MQRFARSFVHNADNAEKYDIKDALFDVEGNESNNLNAGNMYARIFKRTNDALREFCFRCEKRM